MKTQCEECRDNKATHRCVDCGKLICEDCAIDDNYFCNCCAEANIEVIPKRENLKKEKSKKQ